MTEVESSDARVYEIPSGERLLPLENNTKKPQRKPIHMLLELSKFSK